MLTEETIVKTILGSADTILSLLILVYIVYQFLRGNLVTKAMLDRILRESEMRSTTIVAGFKDVLKDAVRDAILEARGEWSKEVIQYARETSGKLENLPCVRAVGGTTHAKKET